MGERNASRGVEKMVLYGFAVAVWLVNAVALSVNGGGFFGDLRAAAATADAGSATKLGPVLMTIVEITIQVFYAGWNWYILRAPVPAGVTTHLRRLINTANDDNSLVVSADGKRAYFSSNRQGGFGNFIYYNETVSFYKRYKKEIKQK